MTLPAVGLEAVIAGLAQFEQGSKTITKAYDDIDKKAGMVESSTGKLGESFIGLGDSMLHFGAIAAGVVAAGIGAAAIAIGGAAVSGLQLNNAMEQASGRIQAFTKDAGETARIIESLRVEAAKTPFTFQQMTDAAASLLPATRASGESLENLIRIAEVLAASNPLQGLEGASFSLREAISGDFTSIIERFNLSRQRLNDLKRQGVPALEAVQIAMKEVGLDTDLVTALANTAEGRWSTFSDTLQNLAATVTQPIFNAWSSGLGFVNDLLAANEPLLTNFAQLLGTDIANAIEFVRIAFSQFSGGFLANVGNDFGFLGQVFAGVEEILDNFLPEEVMNKIFDFDDAILLLIQTITGSFTSGIESASSLFSTVFATAVTFVTDTVLPALTTAILFVNDHWEEFKGAIIGVGAVLASATIASIIAGIAAAVAALATPITGIIVVAGLLGAAWAGNWGGIQDKTLAVWATIQPILSQLVTWLQVNIPAAIQVASQFWTGTLQPAMAQVWTFIQGSVIPILSQLWMWLQTNIPTALQFVSSVWNSVLFPAFAQMQQVLGNFVAAVLPPLQEAWLALSTEWQTNIKPALDNLFVAFGQLATSLGLTTDKVSGTNLVSGILNAGILVLTGTLNAIVLVVRTLTPVIHALGEAISFSVNMTTLMIEGIRSLGSGFTSIKNIIADVIRKIEAFSATAAAITIPDWLIPGSPTPFELALQAIAGTMSGILTSAFTSFGQVGMRVVTSIQVAVQSLSNAFQSLGIRVQVVFSIISSSVAGVSSAFTNAANRARDLANVDFDELINRLGSVRSRVDSVSDKFGDMKNSAEDTARVSFDPMLSALNAIISAIDTIISRFHDMVEAANAAAAAANDANNGGGGGGRGQQLLLNTFRTPVATPAPTPTGAGGGITYNFYNSFGGNNINNGMDTASFDAMVLRSIQRLMG